MAGENSSPLARVGCDQPGGSDLGHTHWYRPHGDRPRLCHNLSLGYSTEQVRQIKRTMGGLTEQEALQKNFFRKILMGRKTLLTRS